MRNEIKNSSEISKTALRVAVVIVLLKLIIALVPFSATYVKCIPMLKLASQMYYVYYTIFL